MAVAVIENPQQQILLARRSPHVHQGGLWEFPGGKCKMNETGELALRRELVEELGITLEHARPLLKVKHDYPDQSVLLDVFAVNKFGGSPQGREGQKICWVHRDKLSGYSFPEANHPILNALRLPTKLLITPDPSQYADESEFLTQLENSLATGIRLVQLRAHSLIAGRYLELAKRVLDICHSHRAELILNTTPETFFCCKDKCGLHLRAPLLEQYAERLVDRDKLFTASAHSASELARAQKAGADAALLAPVMATASHPGCTPLGWDRFEDLVTKVGMPTYALGGMALEHLSIARAHGAIGVAGISGFWNTPG